MGNSLKDVMGAIGLIMIVLGAGVIIGVWIGIIASIAVPTYNFLSKPPEQKEPKDARYLLRTTQHGPQ